MRAWLPFTFTFDTCVHGSFVISHVTVRRAVHSVCPPQRCERERKSEGLLHNPLVSARDTHNKALHDSQYFKAAAKAEARQGTDGQLRPTKLSRWWPRQRAHTPHREACRDGGRFPLENGLCILIYFLASSRYARSCLVSVLRWGMQKCADGGAITYTRTGM